MKAPEICNSDKKRLHCRCFPENFPKCLRITLQNTPGRLLLDILIHLTTFFFCPSSELIETRPFIFADIVYHGFHELCIWKTLRNKRPIEAAVRLCFSEQVFLKISQIPLVKFVKCLRLPFFTNHHWWLLLDPVIAAQEDAFL